MACGVQWQMRSYAKFGNTQLTVGGPEVGWSLGVSDINDNRDLAGKERNLTEVIRRVRTAEAERSDVVVELRDAERARLDMLADELKGIFAQVPQEDEQFLFTVAPGTPPRLWIDMTAFVVMGRDRRTYRFIKDTRLGRTIILETPNITEMGDCVTNYVAERIIERERAIEGDWLAKRMAHREATAEPPARQVEKVAQVLAGARPKPPGETKPDQRAMGWVAASFLLGILLGVLGLLGYAWVAIN